MESFNLNTQRLNVLIVEDHVGLAKNLASYFINSEIVLDFASDGLTALHLLSKNSYDLMVLDLGLPGVNGFDICSKVRQDLNSSMPIIIMTAEDELESKELCFKLGADDYLVKPFRLKELELRLFSLHRRATLNLTNVITIGTLSYDPGTLIIQIQGHEPIQLKGKSSEIFELMLRKNPNFVWYKDIQDLVWGGREVSDNVIRTHIYNLRKQLSSHCDEPLIETLHGKGIRLILPNI